MANSDTSLVAESKAKKAKRKKVKKSKSGATGSVKHDTTTPMKPSEQGLLGDTPLGVGIQKKNSVSKASSKTKKKKKSKRKNLEGKKEQPVKRLKQGDSSDHSENSAIEKESSSKRREEKDKSDKIKLKTTAKQEAKPKQRTVYEHGNYPSYYKYRGRPGSDPRIAVLKPEWFQGEDCLDIGCNSGEVTLRVAETCLPRHIFGIDLDERLIKQAQKNLAISIVMRTSRSRSFLVPKGKGWAGRNVSFRTEDFVNCTHEHPTYGVILCFSVSKWIHLNGGDDALLKLFQKCYDLLKTGGRLLLEPQQWHSYQSKHRVSEVTKTNYSKIKIRPEDFPRVLTENIGFSSCEQCLDNHVGEKGFDRPLYLLIK